VGDVVGIVGSWILYNGELDPFLDVAAVVVHNLRGFPGSVKRQLETLPSPPPSVQSWAVYCRHAKRMEESTLKTTFCTLF